MSKYLCIKTLEYKRGLFDTSSPGIPYISGNYYKMVDESNDSVKLLNEYGRIHTITKSHIGWRKYFLSPEEIRRLKLNKLKKENETGNKGND